LGGDLIDPSHDTASFLGLATTATFTAVAQSRRKIQLTFSEPASIDAAFITPTNYEVTTLDGQGLLVSAVQQTGPDNTRAAVTLGEDLTPGGYYVVKVLPGVAMQSGRFVLPDHQVFQWRAATTPIRIAITAFSGEVTSGLLGEPAGLAFFSPALDVSVPNSVIQVDSVSVCTRAYDVYTIPSPPDPLALFTWPAPLTGAKSEIGASGGVLIASAYRLGQAEMVVQNSLTETLPDADDGPATATLVESVDISRASFLNDDRWRTYPGTGATEGPFILADNLTYIGPGATTVIALQP